LTERHGAATSRLDLIEIELLEAVPAHKFAAVFIVNVSAFPACAFQRRPVVEIGQMQIGFPTHQKSSAPGMRI
jgi:hypothetical protein